MKETKKTICGYPFETYVEMVKKFHGSTAPGVILGGIMVDLAKRHLPEGRLYDAICETQVCLPDAVQLLTPCTIGNGWLHIEDVGRFAITLYDKETGEGIRVHLDTRKLLVAPEVERWFLKKKQKKAQHLLAIIQEIRDKGEEILTVKPVHVRPERYRRPKMGPVAICPICEEAYPVKDGDTCLACNKGKAIY